MTRLVRAFAALTGRRPEEAEESEDGTWPPPIGACLRSKGGDEVVVMARYQSANGEYAIVREKTSTGASYGPLTRADWTSGGYRVVR